MADICEMPTEQLQEEIEKEKQINLAFEKSLAELQLSVEELEKRVDQFDDDNNEWKTRFENQLEVNDHLQQQSQNLSKKLDEAKEIIKELRQHGTSRTIEKIGPEFVQGLERSRLTLEKQLRNLEMRLDQESKAYHRANEERKNMVLEISTIKAMADENTAGQFNTSSNQKGDAKKQQMPRKVGGGRNFPV